MIETIETGAPNLVGIKLTGKLHDEDYRQFEPKIESILTTAGKARLFVQFADFHGWDMHAAWDDLKFGLKHYADFDRIAMVGDRRWERWMARFCKPFTAATVRYFDRAEVEAAWQWLREDSAERVGADDDQPAEETSLWSPPAWPCM